MEETKIEKKIRDDARITLSDEQVSCELEDSRTILNFADGMYYELDCVGACVWDLLKEPREFGEIQSIVLDEYDVEPERCRADLESLFLDMASHGLVEIQES